MWSERNTVRTLRQTEPCEGKKTVRQFERTKMRQTDKSSVLGMKLRVMDG